MHVFLKPAESQLNLYKKISVQQKQTLNLINTFSRNHLNSLCKSNLNIADTALLNNTNYYSKYFSKGFILNSFLFLLTHSTAFPLTLCLGLSILSIIHMTRLWSAKKRQPTCDQYANKSNTMKPTDSIFERSLKSPQSEHHSVHYSSFRNRR